MNEIYSLLYRSFYSIISTVWLCAPGLLYGCHGPHQLRINQIETTTPTVQESVASSAQELFNIRLNEPTIELNTADSATVARYCAQLGEQNATSATN